MVEGLAFFFGIVAFFWGVWLLLHGAAFSSGAWEAEEADTAVVMEMEMQHLNDPEIQLDSSLDPNWTQAWGPQG